MLAIDLETRSACDLKAVGGRAYAKHPTTNLLTVSWRRQDGGYAVWLNTTRKLDPEYLAIHLPGVQVFAGTKVPEELCDRTNEPWVAHNAWGFDEHVWLAKTGIAPVDWIDTAPLALATGLPGGLGDIGVRLWGAGKYEQGKADIKKWSRPNGKNASTNPNDVPPVTMLSIAKYNVQDVVLLWDLIGELNKTLRLSETERKMLAYHRETNTRGITIDKGMLKQLILLTREAVNDALAKIVEITKDHAVPLKTLHDLRSRTVMFKWLDAMKVKCGPSLDKRIIQQIVEQSDNVRQAEGITTQYSGEDDQWLVDSKGRVNVETVTPQVADVINVLELRTNALRITEGKLKAANESLAGGDTLHDLLVAYGAHTGRWTSRRLQIHNMTRAKKGINVWKMVGMSNDEQLSLANIKAYDEAAIAEGRVPLIPRKRFYSADDVSSSMIRTLLKAPPGKKTGAADFSGVESRAVAKLAKEKWKLELFWNYGDPYIELAKRMYGVKDMDKKDARRQIAKPVELGCQYQLGGKTLTAYAAGMGVDLSAAGLDPGAMVETWRTSHPMIAGEIEVSETTGRTYRKGGFWKDLERAAKNTVKYGDGHQVGEIMYTMERNNLVCTLPSQRRIMYRMARIVSLPSEYDADKMVEQIAYEHPRYKTVRTYGGMLCENVVQGYCRDLLAEALIRCEEAGIQVLFHVHDEIVAALSNDDQFDTFMKCMTAPVSWADGFPLDADGWVGPRYAKSPPPGVLERLYRLGEFVRVVE